MSLFAKDPAGEPAGRLLAAVTEASRRPAWFQPGRLPDTLEGRFEAMVLNAALALRRLAREHDSRPLAQAFTDLLFSQFDAGLREAGVADPGVPRRMHGLAGDFFGRLQAYDHGLDGPAPLLEEALARNAAAGSAPGFAAALAQHLRTVARVQASLPLEKLNANEAWPETFD